MSATNRTNALAIAIVIALSHPGATQETGASLDVAAISAAAGAYAQQDVEFRGTASSSSRVAPRSIGEISHHSPGLAENSFDFTNPDSIPGFGILPNGYDARPVLPRFSGE